MVAQFQRLHPEIIAEVKQRLDIVDVISEHVVIRKTGKDFVGLCPFHDERTPSFSVSQSKQLYYCFGCGAAGDAIKFLMELGRHSFTDVVLDLAQRYSVPIDGELSRSISHSLPYPQPKTPQSPPPAKPEKDYTVDRAYVQRSHERLFHQGSVPRLALGWLEGRGFSQEMIRHYHLGLEEVRAKNPESGAWESYWGIAIFIPVPGRSDRFYKKVRVAPWMTGDARPEHLRQWHQTGVPTTVFTTYQPDDATSTYFCEGEWDAMALGWMARQAGANVAIACSTSGCGTLPKPEQLEQLPKPVIIFYDRNDRPNPKTGVRPGDCGAKRLADALGDYGFVGFVPMPHDCTVEGWDVSNALAAGYNWSDFEAAATKASEGRSAIVLYAEPVEYNYADKGDRKGEQSNSQESAGDEWQKSRSSGGNGGGAGKDYGDYRPGRKQVLNFCQQAFLALYGDKPWIYVFNSLYYWNDNYYEQSSNEAEIARINAYCDSYEVVKKVKNSETGENEEVVSYPYARPKFVREVWDWVTQKVKKDPKLVNPPGLNCVDGVLQLVYLPEEKRFERLLVPHDPSLYYLYAPQAIYNTPAVLKPDVCDALLDCLEEPQRQIFLKTIGAALDLSTVRRYRGRGVKALLLLGLGSNGKDTLRQVTSMMFGFRGMTGASLTDFKQYDEGRKFPLAKLDGALLNWPSENADCMLLDRIQSAKQVITGDPLDCERKGKDEYRIHPRCVMLFNVNSAPRLTASIEAIQSRYSILGFNKTYKEKPGPGELQADPRYLYDSEFVRTEVLPWYLYRVLDALDQLMAEGIDYSCTEEAMRSVQEESDHLYAFCREVGIDYLPNGQITATDAYSRLRQWYIDNGTLEVKDLGDGRTKDIWNTQTTWGDHTVKGLNQILPRLLKLFPKADRERDSHGRNCLVGIGFISPDNSSGGGSGCGGSPPNSFAPSNGDSVLLSNNSEPVLNISEGSLKHSNYNHSKGSEAVEANSAISRVKNLSSVLTEQEREGLKQELELSKFSGESTHHHIQQLQNQLLVSDTVSSVQVQPPSEAVQNPSPEPKLQALANQILTCQTWVELVQVVEQDTKKFIKAANHMTKEQRQGLVPLLTDHLCQNPAALNDLTWVPAKLRDKALKSLTFTIRQIVGVANTLDTCLETISGCKFVAVRYFGNGNERWVFERSDGQTIPVFGLEAVEAITLN